LNPPLITLLPVSVAPANCTLVEVTVPLMLNAPPFKRQSNQIRAAPPVKLPPPKDDVAGL